MRFGLAILGVLLPAIAAAQTPPVPDLESVPRAYSAVGGLVTPEEVQKLLPDTMLIVLVSNQVRPTKAAEVLELLRQGKQVRWLRTASAATPYCPVDYSEIDAEKKASDNRLRQMQRRGEIIPVLHQYEQEMYYEGRRNRLYEKICGKPHQDDYWNRQPDMRQKACAALGAICKPRKHW